MGKNMTVSGDIGAARAGQVSKAFPRPIKKAGKGSMTAMPYRKPNLEGGSGPRAV